MKELIDHLKKYLDQNEIDKLTNSFNEENKHAALLNLNKMSDEQFLSLFPNCKKHPIVPHSYIYDKKEYDLGKTIYHELGCFYLQEPSAMLVSHFLNVEKDDFVLDMCAAPGGKTIGASFALNNSGLIISNDISRERLQALTDNISRLGLANIIVTNNDFSLIYQNYLNTFDKIILDAPCSGSGMFRKDDKMLNDWSINKVYKFSMIQMQLIDIAYQMLKPGGRLVYSTCSYSYEEDEEVIKHLLSWSDAKLIHINEEHLYHSKENIGVHCFPHLFPGEGHYICLIEKPGIKKESKYIKGNKNKLVPTQISSYAISKFNDTLFGLPNLINYKKLSIYRYGLKIGELFKDKINYSYELAHHLKTYNQTIDLTLEETQKYLLGEEIHKDNPFNGNVLLTYKNIPLDFAKSNGINLKNHYPKYLRKKVIY